jgi:hypothetical protein
MTVTAEQLTQALDRIYNAREVSHSGYGDIWSSLPEVAGGAAWAREIMDAAESIKGYLTAGEEYDLDDLNDYANEYADSCCETYYKTIHDLVHDLRLWASNDIEADLEAMGYADNPPASLVKWEALYLYSAMTIAWRVVLEQAFTFAEEMELADGYAVHIGQVTA